MTGIDPRTEIPPTGLIRFRQRRRPPFIYSDAEIVALMAQARTRIRQALVAATYETLIGLLAATGMRISEAIKLDRTDIDWAEAVLLVRESKFNKSRYVPLHHSTLEALAGYARRRDQLCPHPLDASFFVSLRRTRLYPCAVQATFRRLCQRAGVGADAPFRPGFPTSGTRWPSTHWLVSRRRRRRVMATCPRYVFGASRPRLHLLLPLSSPGTPGLCRRPARHRSGGALMTVIAPTLQAFFSDRLVHATAREPAHDRLLSRHAQPAVALRAGHRPAKHRQRWSGTSSTSRSSPRSSSTWKPSATTAPGRGTSGSPRSDPCSPTPPSVTRARRRDRAGAQHPPKRFQRRAVTFLTAEESQALIDAPPQDRREGRRDRAMLTLTIQAGLRVSELVAVNRGDVTLGTGGCVRVEGKGRCAARRSVVSRRSREELEGRFLGLMAYPDPKGERDNRMPVNRRSRPGVRADAPWDPRDMAKATLPKPQSPEDARHRLPERHPIRRRALRRHRFSVAATFGARSVAHEGDGDEWGA